MLVLMLTQKANAQGSFREVDSTSYSMYMHNQWRELASYGEKANNNGYDYYYLNVRTGRAFFELKDYKTAQYYFEKALKNNSASDFAREYLFWCLYDQEKEPEALEIYKQLPDSVKEKMDYNPTKPLDYVFVSGGIKFSNDKTAADNLYYGRFALQHKFSPRFDLYHSYTYMQQKQVWGSMQQHQYIFLPGVNLKNQWRISATLNYSSYQSQLNYDDTFDWTNHSNLSTDTGNYFIDTSAAQTYGFHGDYKQNALLARLSINKRIGDWSITPHASWYGEWNTPNYTKAVYSLYNITVGKAYTPPPTFYSSSDTTSDDVSSKSLYNQGQFGLDLNYTVKKALTLGMDINYIYSSSFTKWNVSPYVSIRFHDRFMLSAYFVSKKNYVLSLFGGTQFLNTYDAIKNKISFTADIGILQNLRLFTTYQHEAVTDNLSLRNYQFNSLFIGLKFKL